VIYLEQDEEPVQVDDPMQPGRTIPIRPRRVREVVEITGYQPPRGDGIGHPRYRELFVWDAEARAFRWTGIRPRCADRILRRGWELGIDLRLARDPADADAPRREAREERR
jgi:hypothetical protein